MSPAAAFLLVVCMLVVALGVAEFGLRCSGDDSDDSDEDENIKCSYCGTVYWNHEIVRFRNNDLFIKCFICEGLTPYSQTQAQKEGFK